MFEAIMLVCFGCSWPLSIIKSVRAKRVEGKSIFFLWLIFIGYMAGIANKIVTRPDWVRLFYAVNGAMVMADIILYYRYAARPDQS